MGSTKFGKYELLELIGRGGSSEVWRARDVTLDRMVAVKILNTTDPAARDRFLHEAIFAANISHDNIVRVYDFGEAERRPFLVMELLAGETLDQAIETGTTGGLSRQLDIANQLARAIQHVHGKKLVHRDIKPSNVFLTVEGRALLIDFGIATSTEMPRRTTEAGFVVGTLHYLSPEQVQGQPVTQKSDIYSFGLLLYELFSGRLPFQGNTVAQVLSQVSTATIPVEPLLDAHLPGPLIDLIQHCMRRDPAERPESIAVVIEGLLLPHVDMTSATPAGIEFRKLLSGAPSHGFQLDGWKLATLAGLTTIVVLGGIAGSGWVRLVCTCLAIGGAGRLAMGLWKNGASEGERIPPVPATWREPAFAGQPKVDEMAQAAAAAATQAFQLPQPPRLVALGDPGALTSVIDLGRPQEPLNEMPDAMLSVVRSNYSAAIAMRERIAEVPFRIGRGTGGLNLELDPAVSAEHAEIDFSGGGFTIKDLGSSNGTFVNGVRLKAGQPVPLLFGARILVGSNTEIAFISEEMVEMPDLAGQKVGGRFLLEKKLQGSSKSAVYAARDEDLGQPAAVKILSPGLARQPGYREQFDREARMASCLRHNHICRVIAFGETEIGASRGKTLFVALEYLEGGSLSRRLAQGENFEVEQLASWLDKLCGALGYMHGRNVVHGGIKPSVILFDRDANPLLTDFAVAVTRGGTSQPVVIGAPAFLAPEQWEGAEAQPASDQYSLAAVFYTLLTGTPPYESQDDPGIRKRNFARGPMAAHELAARNGRQPCAAGVSAVLNRALSVNPADRFASAAEFAAAFQAALRSSRARPLVFISYHRASSAAWAQLFKNELERQFQHDVFLDVGRRDAGGRFPPRIERAISECSVFVCLLGEKTLESEWVLREVALAFEHRKPMVPVFQESFPHPENPSALPAHLQDLLTFDGVKLFDRQNLYIDAAIGSLASLIRQLNDGSI